jgi:general secretion pathway protein L
MLLIRPTPTSPSTAAASPEPPALWQWARSADGQRIDTHGQATTDELDTLDTSGGCILVVPIDWLAWHRVQLPPGRAARQIAVIAGLIEDAVLDDPAMLHMALEPPALRGAGPSSASWVAVCRRDALLAALQPLLARGWPVRALVPELAPGPDWVVWAHGVEGAPHVTLAGPAGVLTVALDDVAGQLPLEAAPRHVWAEAATLNDAQQHLPALNWALAPAAQVWLHTAGQGWNLAQFDLRGRVGQAAWQRVTQWAHAWWHAPAWRPARWGVALLLATPVLALPALAWHYQRVERALRAELDQRARLALPGVPVLLDPVRQVRQALEREHARTGTLPPHAVERVLHLWGGSDGLPAVRSLSVDGGQIRLQTEGPAQAQRLREALAPHGWIVTPDADGGWAVTPARPEMTTEAAP